MVAADACGKRFASTVQLSTIYWVRVEPVVQQTAEEGLEYTNSRAPHTANHRQTKRLSLFRNWAFWISILWMTAGGNTVWRADEWTWTGYTIAPERCLCLNHSHRTLLRWIFDAQGVSWSASVRSFATWTTRCYFNLSQYFTCSQGRLIPSILYWAHLL